MKIGKYVAILRIQIASRRAYLGDLAAQSLTIVMFMWIFMHLWKTTYAVSGNSALAGLTLKDTLWYLMVAEVIMLSKPRLLRGISQSIKDGSIAYLLNKPYNFLLYQMSIGLGDFITNAIFNILAGGATVWLLVGPPAEFSAGVIVFFPVLLAWLIDFWINALIGLAAFVVEEVAAFEWIYSKFLLLLGGVLIPLDFFPAWLRTVTDLLPFSATIYGPARLFIEPSMERCLILLLVQSFWAISLGFLSILLYRRGMSWLAINGG